MLVHVSGHYSSSIQKNNGNLKLNRTWIQTWRFSLKLDQADLTGRSDEASVFISLGKEEEKKHVLIN